MKVVPAIRYQLQQVPDFSRLKLGTAVTSFVVGSLS